MVEIRARFTLSSDETELADRNEQSESILLQVVNLKIRYRIAFMVVVGNSMTLILQVNESEAEDAKKLLEDLGASTD